MDRFMKRSPHGLALLLLAIIFVSLNVFSNLSLRAARLDLTQNNLFTLSQGTLNILNRVEKPVPLKFYYSQDIASAQPKLQIFSQHVTDLLEQTANPLVGRIFAE